MKVLLITQYKENIESNSVPDEQILIKHFKTYHLAVYNALLAKGHTVVVASGLEYDLENKIVNSDVVFSIRHDFGFINSDVYIKLLAQKNRVNFVGNSSFSKFYDTDKIVGKILAENLKIRTPKYFLPYQIKKLRSKSPYILKPRFSASSQDIKDEYIFTDIGKLKNELDRQPRQDFFFIEKYINGITATIGCVLTKDDIICSDPYYLKSKSHRLITFEDKRSGNLKREYIKNKIIIDKMKRIARKYFLAIQPCQLARFDFILTKLGKLYFLEVNTTPNLGTTNKFTGSFVKNYFASYENFIDYLVTSAIDCNK